MLCLSVLNNDSRVVSAAKKIGIENFIIRPYNEMIVLKLVESLLVTAKERRFLGSGYINQYNQMIKKNIGLEQKTIGSCRIDFDRQLISNTTGLIKTICEKYKDASFATIIQNVAKRLVKGVADEYEVLFSYHNIMEHYKDDTYRLDRIDLFDIDKKIVEVKSKVVNISNLENGDNVALFVLLDEREEYEKAKVNAALYKTHYELVSLVDIKNNSCEILENNVSAISFNNVEITYESLTKAVVEHLFGGAPTDDFESKISLDAVKEKLKETITYEVTAFKNKSKMEFYQISFKYLDEFKRKIIFYVTDITSKSENDVLTDALTYHGFLNKTYDYIKRGFSNLAIFYCECTNYKDIIEYISVDTMVNFLKNLYKIINNSFLKPYLIGRSLNDSFWVLADVDGVDLSRLDYFKKLNIKENDKIYALYFKFGVYRIEEVSAHLKSTDIDSFCERAKLACNSIMTDTDINYAVFDGSLRDEYILKTTLLNDLKSDRVKSEIEVFYQPIFDIKGKKVHFMEALVRWNHHKYGYIRPDMFIPYLESNGGISEIDKIVVEKVNEFINELNLKSIKVPITVNLSRRDFFNNDLVDLAKEVSKKKNKPSKPMVAFEVTESFNVDISKTISDILNDLRSYNSSILLDDFGDGVSSLKALTSSNFDIIKIYKGLVDEIGINRLSEVAIKSTISMCHAVGIEVIAEGVENKEQLDFLKKAGADYIQGFIFSRPLPKDKVLELLENQ